MLDRSPCFSVAELRCLLYQKFYILLVPSCGSTHTFGGWWKSLCFIEIQDLHLKYKLCPTGLTIVTFDYTNICWVSKQFHQYSIWTVDNASMELYGMTLRSYPQKNPKSWIKSACSQNGFQCHHNSILSMIRTYIFICINSYRCVCLKNMLCCSTS